MEDYNPYKLGTVALTGGAAGVAVLYPEAVKGTVVAAYNRMAPIVTRALGPVCSYLTKVGTRGVTILSGLDYNVAHTFSPPEALCLGLVIASWANIIDVLLISIEGPLRKIGTPAQIPGRGSVMMLVDVQYASWFQKHTYLRLAISHAASGTLLYGVLALAAKVTGVALGVNLPGAIMTLTATAFLIKGCLSALPASIVGQPGRFAIEPPKEDRGLPERPGISGLNLFG
jgi:hypothetical protein